MKDKPLVSIIINCYNSERYLKETIDSVISQTYDNWEIIFWDNQSTDSSAEIIKSYHDHRIRYFLAQNHTTLGEGRNLALKKLKGDFFKFLDADDVIYPSHLENLLPLFSDKDVGIVYSNSHIYDQTKDKFIVNDRRHRDSGDVFLSWVSNYNVLLPSVIVRSSCLNSLNEWFDVRFSMVEEFDFLLRISYQNKVSYSCEVLSFWRRYPESLSFKKSNRWEIEFSLLIEKLKYNYIQEKDFNKISSINYRLAYLKFVNKIMIEEKVERRIIRPSIFRSKKLLLAFVLSFSGLALTRKAIMFMRRLF
ncbi:glycosyltransferase family 2 protein [Vibrio lentus]